jgi:MerR family transcriptional regulator, light-induced transcriptional regulator
MYTIKRAAERAGVAVASLRAWERRYGVVHPARTDAGYRLYDDAAVEQLRTMRRLIAAGWSASAAAGAVISGDVPIEAPDAAAAVGVAAGILVERLVDGARRIDAAGIGEVLDQVFLRASFEHAVDDLLFPALRALGDAWANGEVSVAGEHLVSQAVLQRLLAAFAAAGVEPTGPGSIVVGLPPGSQHEIGALSFATVCRRRGLPVVYLGPNLPVADWLTATATAGAAVLGVPTRRDVRSALQAAQAISESNSGTIVALGGAAAPAGRDGYLLLADDLSVAVGQLDAALA